MGFVKNFLDQKIVTKDVGEETFLTWRENISYAVGRGAQGMCTSMTSSKYINYFMTNVLKIPMTTVSVIRLFCGIFDAINDPMMGILVDKTRTKEGKCRPYIKWAPIFVSIVMILFFVGSGSAPMWLKIAWTTFLFIALDVTYTAFDIPMGALAFSITPNGIERTKLYGVSSILRSILGALPAVFVAAASWLPYFKDHTPQAYLTSAVTSAVGIFILTRFTYKNTKERTEHHDDSPSVGECFRLLFKNRPLFMLFIANIFFLIVKIPEQVGFYFVADLMYNPKYNVFMDVVGFPGFLIAGIFVPAIVEKLGEKADSKKFYQVCCLIAIGLYAIFALSTYGGLVKKPSGTPVSLLVGIITVLFTGLTKIPLECKNLMQKEMEAETVDYVEWKTGRRVEGIMLSIMSFTGKIENTFSASIGLFILGLTHYQEHENGSLAQSPQTNLALFLLTTVVPIVGYLLMLVPMHFYNITGAEHRQMIKDIMARREADAADPADNSSEVAEAPEA